MVQPFLFFSFSIALCPALSFVFFPMKKNLHKGYLMTLGAAARLQG